MPMLTELVDAVIGVDTHTDTHTACLVDQLGRQLDCLTVEATAAGYEQLLDWALHHTPGPRLAWAIEGCRSHGAGLLRALQSAGQLVVEAGRPARGSRRPNGKSDPADARLAARTALATANHAQPRADGQREALRILLVAREHASTTRTAAVNVFKSLILTAPEQLRQSLRALSTPRQTVACARLRSHPSQPIAERVLRHSLRQLAQRIRLLDQELRANERQLRDLVAAVMPALLDQPGVGPISAAHLLIAWSHPGRCRSEAAFAALAGVNPLEASSGRVKRHRLNRFGDRHLNRALHTIVNWRMIRGHKPTSEYLTRRRAQQKTDPEIRRCLKRYTARHLFRLMERAARLDKP
jgi:transposase